MAFSNGEAGVAAPAGGELYIPAQKHWLRQYHLSRKPPLRSGWQRQETIGGVTLTLYRGAEAIAVFDRERRPVGAFIGTVVDIDRKAVVRAPLAIDDAITAGNASGIIERFIYRFGGCWAFACGVDGVERLYLDADGTMTPVFDPDQQAVGASTGLLLDDDAYRARFDDDLYASLNVAAEGWVPAGLTPHRGVERLLANHYLDLKTWKPVRHWPVDEFKWTANSRSHSVRIAEIVRDSGAAALAEGRVVTALTGGSDTRYLMAAFRPFIGDLDFVTVGAPVAHRDVVLAGRLATLAGLRHRVLPFVPANVEEQRQWHYLASHAVTGANMINHPSIRPLAEYKWFAGGLAGEVGRATYWRPTDTETMTIDAATIVPRFGMKPHPLVTDRVAAWLEPIRDLNPLTILDLAFIELRMCTWGFSQQFADSIVPHLYPMIHREAFRLMLELPPEAKRRKALISDGIEALWPELLTVPINRYGDYRDQLTKLRKLTDLRLVAKKLRQKFG